MMIVYDRLYGQLRFTSANDLLFRTPEMRRLLSISLCAIPSWCQPTGVCANRFEHSLGMAYLARLIGRKTEFRDIANNLFFACLAHDLGTPPFCHLGEHFMRQILGIDHETFAAEVIKDSTFAHLIERQGGSVDWIIQAIQGRLQPWSDLVNGSIDLDNLDNTLRYGLSMGILQQRPYNPRQIAKQFGLSDSQICLGKEAMRYIPAWEKCRLKVYEFVYSATNLAPGMMIFRAIGLAHQHHEIDPGFFRKTDREAFDFLENRCNPKTRNLMQRVRHWEFYEQVVAVSSADPSSRFKNLAGNPDIRMKTADEISQILNIPEEDVCVFIGKDRGFKQIYLPIIDSAGQSQTLPNSALRSIWHCQVFLKKSRINKAARRLLQNRIYLT